MVEFELGGWVGGDRQPAEFAGLLPVEFGVGHQSAAIVSVVEFGRLVTRSAARPSSPGMLLVEFGD